MTNSFDLIGSAPGRRKLIAIVYIDMVGYSRLIGLDDIGTLERLRSLRSALIDPAIHEYGGRIVQTGGDSLLIVFDSIDGAVRCAITIQGWLPHHDGNQLPDRAIRFRIGINIGDAIADGTDLHGDSVNVAARLQAECPPGAVCVSRAVRDHVRGGLDLMFDELGALPLKNITHPVEAFILRRQARNEATLPSPVTPLQRVDVRADPARPSLAVLPFANLSGSPEQDYFAEGITGELTMALARVRWFHVVAWHATSTNKNQSIDVRRTGRELDARYVLQGSVRRAGGKLRIISQLVETEMGRHIWADRFDGTVEDIFALQDAVTEAVAGAIEPTLERAEIERARIKPAGNLDAYDLYLRALPLRLRTTREDSEMALVLLRRALALDPGFLPAKAHMLTCHVQRVAQHWAAPGEREEGVRLAREAFAAHGDDPLTLIAVADALGILAFDLEGSLEAALRAVTLNPASCWAHNAAGWANLHIGAPEAAIAYFESALRLHPYDADVGYFFSGLGYAHLMLGDLKRAVALGSKALRYVPVMAGGHRLVIAALVELERQEEAAAAVQHFLQILPQARADPGYRQLYRDHTFVERLIRDFRAAGLPG